MKQLLLVFAFLAIQTFMFTTVTSQNVTSSLDLAVNSSFPVPTSSQNISLNSSLVPSVLPPTSSQNISLNSSLIPSINVSVTGTNGAATVNASVAGTTPAGTVNASVAATTPAGSGAASVAATTPAGSGAASVAATSPAIASSSGAVAAASSSGVVGATGSTSASQSNTPSGTGTSSGSRSSSRTGTNSKTQTSLCGNGIKEANEECEGGECCSHRCRYYKANRACGFRPAGSSPACVKKRRCNGLGVCRPAVIKQNPLKKCTTAAGLRGLCDILTGECK